VRVLLIRKRRAQALVVRHPRRAHHFGKTNLFLASHSSCIQFLTVLLAIWIIQKLIASVFAPLFHYLFCMQMTRLLIVSF